MMPTCSSCGQKFGWIDLRGGICSACRERKESESKAWDDSLRRKLTENPDTTDFGEYPDRILDERAANIIVTTGGDIPGRVIENIIDVIGSEAALGLNIFKDIANNWRDFFGGRSKTVQAALKDARSACLVELRREALHAGADAVIGLKMDFSEMSTASSGGILFVAATGTAVKLREK